MGKTTAIDWTDHTFNPWWGCEKISPGCSRCYAATFAKRTGHDVWGPGADRRTFGDGHWNEPLKWERAARAAGRPALVFCASMADVFEDHPAVVDERARLWDLVARTPSLRWLLLTKRPENVRAMVPDEWLEAPEPPVASWWPSNVWIGTTVEDQEHALERIPVLLEIPAHVRFLSCEPLLGPVDLTEVDEEDVEDGIHWIIAGGESGAKYRALDVDHARALRDQADAYGIPFFYKQTGGLTPKAGGRLIDGRLRWAWPADAGDRSDVVAAAMAEEGIS